MAIFLLDNTLRVEIFYEASDREFADNICIQLVEDCPDDERILRGEETNIYLTADQACQLAYALDKAVEKSRKSASGCRD